MTTRGDRWDAGRSTSAGIAALVLAGAALLAAQPAQDIGAAGRGLIEQGRYAEAEALARNTLASLAGAGRSSTLEAAAALEILVETLWRRGRVAGEEALEAARRAAILTERELGPEDPRVAVSLRNLGRVLERKERLVEAKSILERAMRIHERTPGSGSLELARTQDAMADILLALGEPDQAQPLYGRAIENTTVAAGPDHPDNAEYLRNLGQIQRDAGDLEGARVTLERALAVASVALGGTHPRLVWFLNSLAILEDYSGRLAEAKRLYERALAIARERSPGDDHRLLTCLNNLAHVLAKLGDFEEAAARYEEALGVTERLSGARHPDFALVLSRLGSVARSAGDYGSAAQRYQRAIEIYREVLGPDHTIVAGVLVEMAELALLTGDYERSRVLSQEALIIWDKTVGTTHFDYALAAQVLARTFEAEGRLKEAVGTYRGSLVTLERTYGRDHPAVAAALCDFARALARGGRQSEALRSALRAESIARAHRRLLALTLVERESLRFAEVRVNGLDVALSLGPERLGEDDARAILDSLVRSRALVLDAVGARQREWYALTSDDIVQDREALVRASRRVANLMASGPGDDPAGYRQRIAAARAEKERIEADLAALSLGPGRMKRRPEVGLDAVEKSLPADSVLVSYVLYRRSTMPDAGEPGGRPPRAAGAPHAGPFDPVTSYQAIVLRRGEHVPRFVPLGPARGIDSLVETWRREVTRAPSGGIAGTESERACRVAGEALRRAVWDPIVPWLGSADRLLIVPDGTLNLVNLYALPADEGRYLIDTGVAVHYLSAERDLVPEDPAQLSGRGLLAVGGASFDAIVTGTLPEDKTTAAPGSSRTRLARGAHTGDVLCLDLPGLKFEPLPGTEKETRRVIEIWDSTSAPEQAAPGGRRAAAVRAGESALLLVGTEASESNLKRLAPGKRVLHLATHGFLSGTCGTPREGLRAVGALVPGRTADEPPAVPARSRLPLSGLALAGSNHRAAAAPDEEDGILMAEEIAVMDLSGIDWVVLSACDTGLGSTTAGEGVLGLRRAFRIAGARTLITSLWAVDDAAVQRWVEVLYIARLLEGRDTMEAVRQASASALARQRRQEGHGHPFHWAPFVAAGQWR